MLLHSPRKRSRTVVIETGAVDQRFVFTQSKQARPRIAGLRMVSHSARFDKTKTKRSEWLQCDTVLIQACCKSDRIRKRQTESLNLQRRVTVRLRE